MRGRDRGELVAYSMLPVVEDHSLLTRPSSSKTNNEVVSTDILADLVFLCLTRWREMAEILGVDEVRLRILVELLANWVGVSP